MKPTSVTPTLAPREADDTAICARKSLAEPSGYGHRSAASPPAARDGRGRLRRDGPRARLGSCSGRSSSSRLHLRWRRASLVVLALLALVVAPGTTFVTATESGKGPRGRRLAQANPVPDLHLVADDITDVDASNLVQSWSDTGNGLSLSSFVSAPELVDGDNMSTGALFNGHKAVRFGKSGITGLSLPTSALQLPTSLEGMTVVAVVRTDSRDATAPVLFDRGFRGNRGFGFIISPAKVDIYSPLDHGGRTRTNTAPPIESGKMYVVTTQWKFAKSGVGGYQLATTQHGDLSNPDLLPVEAITWTGTGVDYSTPFVIGAQSKSYKRHEGRWLEGYVAEFRYYFQVLHQNEVTAIQDELLDKYGEACDASAPPANGGVGDCTDKLKRGTTCQPTCDEHYVASGVSKCITPSTFIPAQCLGPCDMDTWCYSYNKRRGFNVPETCAHLDYTPPPPPLPLSAVGGTISYADGYKIHTFTTTGPNMFTVTSGGTIEYLVVAGGGGGGAAHTTAAGENPGAGGGGAGGIITGTLTVDVQQYTITVGAGGAGVAGSTNPANGNNGEDSSISSLVVAKGGGGGGKGTDGVAGLSGGCGGGAGGSSTGANSGSGGSGSIGFDGGDSLGVNSGGGGGGGMGTVGGDGGTLGGNGGDGIPSSISGTLTFRGAGGGGGKGDSARESTIGGNGGGGNGSSNAAIATAGAPNTGSGGGGGKDAPVPTSNGAAGGSGIVILRYLSPPSAG